jgi:WhiB family redox-sensing transcriptional regulator
MTDWDLGACRKADADLWFPTGEGGQHTDQIAYAKAICRGCPIKDACRTEALNNRIEFGIWGGTTERERRDIWDAQTPRKQCTGCGATKPLTDFYHRPGRGKGFKSRCKACENVYAAESRARSKARAAKEGANA